MIDTTCSFSPSPHSSSPLTLASAFVVIWWSSGLQLASPVGSNLPSCMCGGLAVSHLKGEVSLFRGLDVIGVFTPTPEEEEPACHAAPSLLFSFLSPSPSLSKGNANACNKTPPHLYFKSLLPSVSGCARGWQNQGRWNESREGWVGGLGWGLGGLKKSISRGSRQPPAVFSVFLIRNPLKLFNLAAEPHCTPHGF